MVKSSGYHSPKNCSQPCSSDSTMDLKYNSFPQGGLGVDVLGKGVWHCDSRHEEEQRHNQIPTAESFPCDMVYL